MDKVECVKFEHFQKPPKEAKKMSRLKPREFLAVIDFSLTTQSKGFKIELGNVKGYFFPVSSAARRKSRLLICYVHLARAKNRSLVPHRFCNEIVPAQQNQTNGKHLRHWQVGWHYHLQPLGHVAWFFNAPILVVSKVSAFLFWGFGRPEFESLSAIDAVTTRYVGDPSQINSLGGKSLAKCPS